MTDWTHKEITIKDIRKLKELYSILIDENDISFLVNETIFDERVNSYFLFKPYTREQLLKLKWNMHITKGYFVKLYNGELIKKMQDSEKYYCSFLEISGDLATFNNIINKK